MVKKILSIDGGGIKGIFAASFLSSLEDSLDENISNYFDLIVGTSTGGIIAIALGLGFSAKETLSFYEKLGPTIFKGIPILRYLRWIIFSKYNQNSLRKALSEKFVVKDDELYFDLCCSFAGFFLFCIKFCNRIFAWKRIFGN